MAELGSASLRNSAVKSFTCPNCGGSIEIRAVGISISAVCQSCGSLVDVANETVKLITAAKLRTRPILIPLGTRGTLFGTEWEVIGYVHRYAPGEDKSQYFWDEFLLFNPYQGFRFLSHDHGHWTFYCMLRQDVRDPKQLWQDGHDYTLFNNGTAVVEYVLGEFYWRVKVGETVRSCDYIAPPYTLSLEENDSEQTWSCGVYIPRGEIAEAFTLTGLPDKTGIGSNQPSPVTEKVRPAAKVFIACIVLLIILQAVPFYNSTDKGVIFTQTFHANPGDLGKTVTSEPFIIPSVYGSLQVEIASPVENNWLGLDISLVNQASDLGFNAPLEVEHYSGRDSDGPWMEGHNEAHAVLSNVPGGTYRLLIEPNNGTLAGATQHPAADFTVRLQRHVRVWGIFWLAIVLAGLYPLFLYFYDRHFERKRWENSDLPGEGDEGEVNTPKQIGNIVLWSTVILFILIEIFS